MGPEDVETTLDAFIDFSHYTGLSYSPDKTRILSSSNIKDATITKWQQKYSILAKNINNQLEFLGYLFSLNNDHDLKNQQFKICTEIFLKNLNRSKQLPITALGREVFGCTYLSSANSARTF